MQTRIRRRHRSRQERREIVEETFKPGQSVSLVARAHDINANQLFHWRKLYREGWFDEATAESAAMVPVRITSDTDLSQAPLDKTSTRNYSKLTGMIEVTCGSIRVRIEGAADPDCVRAVMDRVAR